MKKIVFFDLDGTLTDNPSSEKLFFSWLLFHGYIGLRQIFATLLFFIKWLPKFKQQVFVKNKGYLYNLSVEKVAALGREFATNKLLPRVRARMQKILNQHLAAGDLVILLTGSPDFIAEVFAEYLEIPKVYAMQYATQDGRFANLPPLQHPYAHGKLELIKRICTEYKFDIKNTVAYANSIHDFALLQAVGVPIAVTPDRKLRKIATAQGWEILS